LRAPRLLISCTNAWPSLFSVKFLTAAGVEALHVAMPWIT
jgi:hypothetical protein